MNGENTPSRPDAAEAMKAAKEVLDRLEAHEARLNIQSQSIRAMQEEIKLCLASIANCNEENKIIREVLADLAQAPKPPERTVN